MQDTIIHLQESFNKSNDEIVRITHQNMESSDKFERIIYDLNLKIDYYEVLINSTQSNYFKLNQFSI